MYKYLVNCLVLVGVSLFLYYRTDWDWKIYILLAGALVHLGIFFYKLTKSQKQTDSQ